jgi:L-ascorbate metabolism protein UlaG (beta-lactamase superfamily)
MELTWYGRTCIRLRGKDAVVVNDPTPPSSGRPAGITGDVITFSHPDDSPLPKKATKLSRDGGPRSHRASKAAFVLDGPGEYEVRDVLLTGVRTYRDDAKGAERGRQVAFVTELDGIHTIHLGDIGHQLTEEKLADIGRVEVACVPIGGALSATRAAALIAQLDPKIVVPMTVCEDEADCEEALKTFLHEMGAQPTVRRSSRSPHRASRPRPRPSARGPRQGIAARRRRNLSRRLSPRQRKAEPSTGASALRGARARSAGDNAAMAWDQPPGRWTTWPPLTTASTRFAPTQ